MNEKRHVRIDFSGFWDSFNKEKNLFTSILSKYFKVEISDQPDFIICSNRGNPFAYMNYDCVRIMFMGENMSPDFTVFDYVIGFDDLSFRDRYFRLPFAFYSDAGEPWTPDRISKEQAKDLFDSKKHFCNFIYGHESSHGMREKLFQKLATYRPVVSPGSYLNNTGGGVNKRCSWRDKKQYLRESKFTIAGDSIVYPGFVTEKIVQPFQQHSIPVYFGNPEIYKDFNTDAFVWCRNEADIDRVLEEIAYLDQHDDAYIEMLMKYPLAQEDYLATKYRELEAFLVNIFEQDKESAYRRVRYFCASNHERYLREYAERYERTPQMIHRMRSILTK